MGRARNNIKANVLIIDIETAPSKAHIWSLWQEVKSTDFIIDDWFILCWYGKWLGKDGIIGAALPDFSSYKKDPDNDKRILEVLWPILDEADIVIVHNAKFDCRKINSRFLMNDMTPPSPFKVIDTLIAARKGFSFTSNKLGDLGKFFQVGKKIDTGGFELWKRCLEGDEKAWKKMITYCQKDVKLLEKVYLKLRPYIGRHPNMNVYTDEELPLCPKCGSARITRRGYAYTATSKFQKYNCLTCGSWSRTKINEFNKEKNKNILRNIV